MSKIRTLLVLILGILLFGGFLASTLAYQAGTTAKYIAALDSSMVPWLAVGLLIATVVLALVPDPEQREDQA
jgi:hypothetical protein